MLGIIKRKRCKQCGEELKMFTKVDFCSLNCAIQHNDIWEDMEIPEEAHAVIYECIWEIARYEPTKVEINKTYARIPRYIHSEAAYWSWRDTEVSNQVYSFLEGVMKGE